MTALIAGYVEARCAICDVNVEHRKGEAPRLCPGPKHYPHEFSPALRGPASTRESASAARGDSAAKQERRRTTPAPVPSVSRKKEKS